MSREWRRGEYVISTDRDRLDVSIIHDFLSNRSYWAQGRTPETVTRSINNSLNFGLFKSDRQIGFARVVTDYATFAWLADVFVLEQYRAAGLGKWLIEVIMSHPDLQGFRRWVLATKDAHKLYRDFGFHELKRPERWMERPDPQMQENPDYWRDDSR
ncbi:MAG: GNAT family N-acetyltransferase [Pyrinomonadaceae bacterium]